MKNNIPIQSCRTGDGRTVVRINGKVYNLLRGYGHHRAGGWFFLAVAGRTPLKPDDLDKYWDVVRANTVSLAYAQRPFSYHFAEGGEPAPPYGVDWPRFRRGPGHLAFVGPTEEAVRTQLQLVLEQYRPDLELDTALERAVQVPDVTGQGPDALLVKL